MSDPNRRFQVVEEPVFAPGADYITKTPNGPFIDTGLFVGIGSGRERIYLSKDTIFEMADTLGLFDDVLAHAETRYQAGYNDAVKENLGGDIRDIADRLGAVVPYLAGLAGPDLPVEAPSGEDSGAEGSLLDGPDGDGAPFVVDSVESIAERTARTGGQGDGAGRNERPAELPASAGDESLYRI